MRFALSLASALALSFTASLATADDLDLEIEAEAEADAPTLQARRETPPEGYREDPAPDTADDDFLAPGTRPMMVNVGIGPSLGIVGCNDNGCSSANNFSQVKLTQEFIYHFSGTMEGFGLGFSIDEAFGDNLFRLQPGVKAQWDFLPSENLGLYIAPFVKAGFAYLAVDAGPFGSASDGAFNLQSGVEARLVLGDRATVFFRPVGLDMLMDDSGVAVAYDIIASGGVTF